MAHRAALGCSAVARQLSVLVMVVSIIALVAATAGTSYAKKPKPPKEDTVTEDTVVVSNFGSLFAGSVETFTAGSIFNSAPAKNIIGPNTLLGDGNGAAGDAQSSLDLDIAVAVPLGLAGVFPHGFIEIYSAGENHNASPEEIIGSPTPFGAPDLTGLSLPQGVTYADPFRGPEAASSNQSIQGLVLGDELAVANFTPAVVELDGDPCPGPVGFTLGTITEYSTFGLATFVPATFGGINDIPPLNNTPVTPAGGVSPTHNATLGGCNTALFGPLGLTFDSLGFLYVVNELAKYVTVYEPGASGNEPPLAIIGAFEFTAGAFVDPAFIAVSGAGEGATIYVTDVGDNSIKIFSVFTNRIPMSVFTGTHLSTIAGGHTKLVRPEGIALGAEGALYVVNNNANSLSMFDDFDPAVGGNISPKLIIKGKPGRMNFPVGVARKQFTRPAL